MTTPSASPDARGGEDPGLIGVWPYLLPYLALGASQLFDSLWLRAGLPLGVFLVFLVRGDYPELRGPRLRLAGLAADVVFGVGIALLWTLPYLWSALPRPEAGSGFDASQAGALALGLRLVGFAGGTPFVEELFVRSFLVRYVDAFRGRLDFRTLPVARFSALSFGLTVLFFTVTHQPWEWVVALPTGILLNLWLLWRRDLRAVIVAHAAANASIWLGVVAGADRLGQAAGGGIDPWVFL